MIMKLQPQTAWLPGAFPHQANRYLMHVVWPDSSPFICSHWHRVVLLSHELIGSSGESFLNLLVSPHYRCEGVFDSWFVIFVTWFRLGGLCCVGFKLIWEKCQAYKDKHSPAKWTFSPLCKSRCKAANHCKTAPVRKCLRRIGQAFIATSLKEANRHSMLCRFWVSYLAVPVG